MAGWATNITSSKTCADDLTKQNPLITYAQLGLESYQPLYRASCLHNPSSTEAEYCFADAITSSTNPADSFIYYLPYNDTLPGGSQPTCSTCLKNTMAVFQAATSDRSSALVTTYPSAALAVNINCGPSFVNASLAAAVVSGAQVSQPLSNVGILALVVLISSWLL